MMCDKTEDITGLNQSGKTLIGKNRNNYVKH